MTFFTILVELFILEKFNKDYTSLMFKNLMFI